MWTKLDHTGPDQTVSYVCRRQLLDGGKNLPHRPHSSAPWCCSGTLYTRRCCGRSFPPHRHLCGRYSCRVDRAGSRLCPLQGCHRTPPCKHYSGDLRAETHSDEVNQEINQLVIKERHIDN